MACMIEGTYQGFGVEISTNGVAIVTFTRPERLNAMSFGMRRDLVEVLTLAQLDDAVRVVVITGSGRGFCAGMYLGRDDAEVPTLAPDRPDARHAPVNLYAQLRLHSQELTRAVRRLDKLTIAAVNGFAIQIGLSLALACDYVLAARSAKLGSATLRMGYQPDEGGHWLLVEHLGVKRALDFVMRQRIVDADEAAAMGLVTEVVDDEALVARVLELADELARTPGRDATPQARDLQRRAPHVRPGRRGHRRATAISDFHPDALEGAPAWLRKEHVTFNRWLDD